MRALSLKWGIIGAILAVSVVFLIAWSQSWFSLGVPSAPVTPLAIGGETASPALTALALASIALAFALALAGPAFRFVLAILELAIAGCVGYSAIVALSDPVSAAAPRVTAATGIAGSRSVRDMVTIVEVHAWPVVVVIGAALLVVASILIIVTTSLWPRSSRKYQPVRMEPHSSLGSDGRPRTGDASDDWDALTRGSDPTDRER